eukprot:g3491.t1
MQRPGSLSKKDKKEQRKLQKQQQKQYLQYYAAANGVETGMGRKKQLRALQEIEKKKQGSNKRLSLGMQIAVLQMALWWVGIIWSQNLDAALRLVMLPLSLGILYALSILVSYALVSYQQDRQNPDRSFPVYPPLIVWNPNGSIEWNLMQTPARLFVTLSLGIATVGLVAAYDWSSNTIGKFNAQEVDGFSAFMLLFIPGLFCAALATVVLVALPFGAIRNQLIPPLYVYGVHLAGEVVGFVAWIAWLLFFRSGPVVAAAAAAAAAAAVDPAAATGAAAGGAAGAAGAAPGATGGPGIDPTL